MFLSPFLVIEDFGDITFKKALTKSKNKLNIYKRLVNELIKIQKIKPPKKLKIFNGKNYELKKYSFNILKQESNLFFANRKKK